MIFGIGFAFSKDLGSTFSEGPGPRRGPLYKVCRFMYLCVRILYIWKREIASGKWTRNISLTMACYYLRKNLISDILFSMQLSPWGS